jgi:hypothetical protein
MLHQRQRSSVINVVTFLSPSLDVSRQWLEHIRHWTQDPTTPIIENGNSNSTSSHPMVVAPNEYDYDALDELLLKNSYYNMLPSQLRHSWLPPRFNSVALWVGGKESGSNRPDRTTLIHCVSSSSNPSLSLQPLDSVDLLAIQSFTIPKEDDFDDSIVPVVRDRLATKITQSLHTKSGRSNYWMEKIQTWFYNLVQRRSSTKTKLPNSHERLPILDIQDTLIQNDSIGVVSNVDLPEAPSAPHWDIGDLKEIVVPTYWSDTYSHNNATLLSTLSNTCQLRRPVTGLYQLSPFSKLCIRPLPMAQEDRRVLTPTLVFHCDDHGMDQLQSLSTDVVKIGYTGQNRNGQLMIPNILSNSNSLNVRLCSTPNRSSMFAEAQDSLLASSIHELQSQDVLASSPVPDPRTNQTDCWVEFRATLRRPLGFVPSFKSNSTLKVARAPDLPYE